MPIGTGAAILGSALIGGATSLFAGGQQKAAADQALQMQQMSLMEQRAAREQAQANIAPYLKTGKTALGQLSAIQQGQPGWDNFLRSPDYQFRLGEGTRALENSAASRGGLLSGNFLRGVTSFGQGMASNEFNNYWSRIMDTAKLGQSSAVGAGSLGIQSAGQIGNTANAMGNTIQAGGAASASGPVGAANSLNSGIQNYLFMNALQSRPQQSSYLPQQPVMSGSIPFQQSSNYWGAG